MTGEPDPDAGVVVVLSAATSPVHEDPIPAALAAIQAKITGGRTARLLLTDRVTALEGQAAVPGPAGPAGAAGKSVTGPAGPAGATGAAGKDGALSIQRAVLTSGADGSVVWTYPAAYAAGVVPVISALAEAPAGASPYVVQIDGVPSNTSVKFYVHKSAQTGAVTSFSAAASVRLHLLAIAPT
jgi:hypothetical protein